MLIYIKRFGMAFPAPCRYQMRSVGIAGVAELQAVQTQDLKKDEGEEEIQRHRRSISGSCSRVQSRFLPRATEKWSEAWRCHCLSSQDWLQLAEKHGQALLGKGYGVMINLWTYSETHHAMWQVTCVKRDGVDSGVRLVVDANTGALEEIVKH